MTKRKTPAPIAPRTNSFSSEMISDQAIGLYGWALNNPGTFKLRDVPGGGGLAINRWAMKMLIDRGLIIVVDSNYPQTYVLGRSIDPMHCLEIPESARMQSGVVRYHVDPVILEHMATSPDLRNYSI